MEKQDDFDDDIRNPGNTNPILLLVKADAKLHPPLSHP